MLKLQRNLSENLTGPVTSQKAEIVAVIAAIQQAIKYKAGTYCKNLVNFATKLKNKWKNNG